MLIEAARGCVESERTMDWIGDGAVKYLPGKKGERARRMLIYLDSMDGDKS